MADVHDSKETEDALVYSYGLSNRVVVPGEEIPEISNQNEVSNFIGFFYEKKLAPYVFYATF